MGSLLQQTQRAGALSANQAHPTHQTRKARFRDAHQRTHLAFIKQPSRRRVPADTQLSRERGECRSPKGAKKYGAQRVIGGGSVGGDGYFVQGPSQFSPPQHPTSIKFFIFFRQFRGNTKGFSRLLRKGCAGIYIPLYLVESQILNWREQVGQNQTIPLSGRRTYVHR